MAEQRPLTASELERILKIYLRVVQELPPDIQAGHLDAAGQLHFAPDIGQKLRAARAVLGDIRRIQESGGGDKPV